MVKSLKPASAATDVPQWDQTARSNQGGVEKVAIPGTASGVVTVDASLGNVHVVGSVTANITSWVFNNLPSSGACTLTILIPMGATLRTVAAFPGTLHWLNPAPAYAINKVTVITAMTLNAGADWFLSAATEI